MAINFPTSLDNFANHTDGTTVLTAAILNEIRDAVDALEAKLGADGSVVVSSHDYKLAHQKLVQIVNTQSGSFIDCDTVMPWDDSIPQNTEGDEVMTLAVTPSNAANILKIEVVVQYGIQAHNNHCLAALFQDSTAASPACGIGGQSSYSARGTIMFTHWMTAGTTSNTTFKVRLGASAGGVGFNGTTSRIGGGVASSSITITELNP